MAALPAGVGYGTVKWTAAAAVMDTASDVDLAPDLVSVLGTVTFTPSVQVFRVPAATPPLTLFAGPVSASLYSDGTLRDTSGNIGVTLMATDSPGLDIAPSTWSWFVSFALTSGRTRPGFSFMLNSGQTIDLTTISPVGVGTGGVQVTQGQGISSAVVNGSGNLIITYTTGLVVDAGNIATVVSSGDASTTAKGIVKLANALSGTALLPLALGLNNQTELIELVEDTVAALIDPGENTTVVYDDAGRSLVIDSTGGGGSLDSVTYENLPAGTTITILKAGSTWPVRPTSRADIVIAWKGPDPDPAIVSSGTGGMLDNVDYRLVTP